MNQAQRPAVGGVRPTFTFAYNAIGLPTQTVDPAGITTTHVYDALGNLTSTTEGAAAVGANPALNLTTTFTPDAVGNVIAATDPLLHVSNQTGACPRADRRSEPGDADRRAVLAIQPDPGAGVRTASKTTYDANGRTVQAEIGRAHV